MNEGKIKKAIACVEHAGVWRDRCCMMLFYYCLQIWKVSEAKAFAKKAASWQVRSKEMVEAYWRNKYWGNELTPYDLSIRGISG